MSTAIVIMKFITLLLSCIALGMNIVTLIQLDKLSKEADNFFDDDDDD